MPEEDLADEGAKRRRRHSRNSSPPPADRSRRNVSRSRSLERSFQSPSSSESRELNSRLCRRRSRSSSSNSSRRQNAKDGCSSARQRRRSRRSRLKPNSTVLALLVRDQIRTNDRMDQEEVRRADVALRTLDPTTTLRAQLMTEYLQKKDPNRNE